MHIFQKAGSKLFYGHVIVLSTFLMMMVGMAGYNIFGMFFEPVLKEFGWTRAMTSGAFSLSMILGGFLSVVSGRLADRFGPRLLLTVSGILQGLSYLLVSQINAVWQFYLAFGIVMGAGIGTMIVPLGSTVARWFERNRGMAIGMVMAGTGVGTMILPLWLGVLIQSYSWRAGFIALGIASLLLIALNAQLLKNPGVSDLSRQQREGPAAHNVMPRSLSFRKAISNRQLQIIWAIFACSGFASMAIMVHIVIHATGLGISAANAANILAVIGGASIIGRLTAGRVGDLLGNKTALIIGLFMLLASLVWLQFARVLWTLYVFGVLFGIAWGWLFILPSPILADFFGLGAIGLLFGIVQTGLTVGATLGPFILGYLFDLTQTYAHGFMIATVITLVGLVLTVLLKPRSTAARR
ncbi:MAG: MFS transporter [Chloroflexi bacterium]|nr:MFS transporter [Chloroflexota bacterium]